MKKINFAFLSLTAIMTLAGCNAAKVATTSAAEDTGYQVPASRVTLRRKSKSLFVGETYKLETLIRPFRAYNAHLNYSSSDTNIATVDESGKVTAKSSGSAIISVFTDDYNPEDPNEDLIDEFEIVCIKKSNFAAVCGEGKAADEMLAIQEELPEIDSAILYDYRTYALLKDGKTVSDSTTEYQRYVVSKSLGLVSYDSLEIDVDVLNGGETFTEYGYSFYTTANFSSYIYHRNDNVKKYCYAATEFNKGREEEGITRYSTVLEVIGSLFSVPGTYFTSAVDDIYEESQLEELAAQEESESGEKFGYYKDSENTMLRFYLSFDYTKYPDSAFIDEDTGEWISWMITEIEDELRYASNLPAGIKYKPAITMDFTWVNGYVKDFYYVYDKAFTWDGVKYTYRTELKQNFQVITAAEAEEFIPDSDEYDSVEHYYDL